MVSGCCMADEDAARWMLAHTPSVFTSAKNKALMATFHAAKAAAAASGATSTVPDPTLRGLFSVSKPADGGSGIQCADVMDESECSWHSRMTLLSTNPDTLAEDGIVQQGKQSVWPRVAMEAFSAVATKPFGPVGAVSSLMRAVWLCLHQYGFPARQTRLPLLLQVGCTTRIWNVRLSFPGPHQGTRVLCRVSTASMQCLSCTASSIDDGRQ